MKQMILGTALLLLSGIAHADTVFEYRNMGGNTTHTIMKVGDGRVLVHDLSQSQKMLFMSNGSRMYMLDPGKRRYTQLDEDSMKQMAGQVDQAMAEMEKQLANMPPAQREQMRNMMSGMMNMGKKMMEPTVERSGRTGEYGGFSCEFVTITVPNITRSELCVSDEEDLGLTSGDSATLQAMQDHFERISKVMSETLGMSIPFNQVNGVPVLIKDDQTPGGRVLHITRDADIAAGELDIPEGYREVPLEQFGQ